MLEQRYDEEEQRRIITRALELQRGAGVSLSANELETAAAEVGIERTYLLAAMEESRTGTRTEAARSPVGSKIGVASLQASLILLLVPLQANLT